MPPKPEVVDLSAVRAARDRKEQCKAVHAQILELARYSEENGLRVVAYLYKMAALAVEDEIMGRPPRMPEPPFMK